LRKALTWLGGVFLGFVLLGGLFFGYVAIFVGPPLDASSKAYVDQNIPAIVSSWSADELISRSSPELLAAANKEQINQLLAKLSSLGKLKRYLSCNGDSNLMLNIGSPNAVTAQYVSEAEFENGRAQITTRLIQRDGKWQIMYFYVSSPLFLK